MIGAWFRVIALVLLAIIVSGNAFAFDWKDLWQRPDQRAYELLQSGESVLAAEAFDDPQWRGVSRYRAGEFEQAQKEFSSLESDAALYNQGVTAVRQGEFDVAVEKFENLLQRSPDHADGQHNLDIARELAKQQRSDQKQPQDGDQQQENKDQQDQQDQKNSEGDGQGQQAEGDTEGEQGDSDNTDDQRGGELAAEPDDAAADQAAESDEDSSADQQSQAQQDSEQSTQQQAGGAPESPEGDAEQQAQAAMSQAGPSESEQATEQWLRRIPDDPSQLLRNKIKLNHMIEHADVQDMQEPW